jgi:putative ABC transport system permease protein
MLGGAAIGRAAAAAVLPMVNQSTGGRFPPLFVAPETWMLAAAVAVAVALAVGVPPALRARRLRIVDALAGHR